MSVLESSGEAVGLTDDGIRRVVANYADLPDIRQGRAVPAKALRSLYGALIRRDEAMARLHLRDYFVPAQVNGPHQGSYTSFGQFYDDYGKEQLEQLPGVSTTDGGRLEFTGIDPSDLDLDLEDDETRPLEEIRDDPRTEARIHLAERHGPSSDEYEDLLKLFDAIHEPGETTTADLADDHGLPSIENYAAQLEGLPGIAKSTETVTASDILLSDLETLRDLMDAKERVPERVETWTFDGN